MVCRDNHARACQRSRNTAPMLIQSGGAKSDAKADTPPMRRSAQAAEAQPGVLRARAVSTSLSRSAPTTNESAGSPSRKHIEPFDRSRYGPCPLLLPVPRQPRETNNGTGFNRPVTSALTMAHISGAILVKVLLSFKSCLSLRLRKDFPRKTVNVGLNGAAA